jgi:hypothetical protein
MIDGASAWFYPYARPMIAGIILGSTFKGLITGMVAGFVARRWHSLPLGIMVGFLVGLLLSFAVAAMGAQDGNHYYWQIMIPGAVLGAICGFATQRYGRLKTKTA